VNGGEFTNYLNEFEKRKTLFIAFLTARGAEILQPTNIYEILRFRAGVETCVMYRNSRSNDISFNTTTALAAWDAFVRGNKWEFTIAAPRPQQRKKHRLVVALLDRDGKACFYCGQEIPSFEETLEHMVPVAHGGNSHLSNLVLADELCNKSAGHLSVMEKIKRREELKSKQ